MELLREAEAVFLEWVAWRSLHSGDSDDITGRGVAMRVDNSCSKEQLEILALVEPGHNPLAHQPVWLVALDGHPAGAWIPRDKVEEVTERCRLVSRILVPTTKVNR